MNPWLYLLLPVIGAVIGYVTNWLAVKMIFRPRRPFSVLGIRIEGLIPRRRHELAKSVARTVEKELLSVEEIQKLVKKIAEGDELRAALHQRIDSLIDEQLKNLGPMIQTFVSSDAIDKIKLRIEDEVVQFIESMSRMLHDGLDDHLNIGDIVRERIEGFDLEKLEAIVFRIAARELRHIEILGGVLGFLVGALEVVVIALVG